MSILAEKSGDGDWIKVDLHIHTLDDPKDVIDYSAHQLLERARALGFGVLAITLHNAVFDRQEVFADAAAMGILLIPAAEVRLCGADVIVLNVTADEIAALKNFDDLRQLLNEEMSGAPPFAWVESIHDETRPAIDIAARRATPDFVGDFLQVGAAARRALGSTDPDEHAAWLGTLRNAVAPLFDESQRGRRHLRDSRPDDEALFGELLDAAESIGLDLLLAAEDR